MEVISRDKTISTLQGCIDGDSIVQVHDETFYEGYVAGLSRAIDEIKSIGVEPVRSVAAWGELSNGVYSCSCGYISRVYTNFCPNCGALKRMKARWRYHRAVSEAYSDVYVCEKCDRSGFRPTNYCSNCGSEMSEDK